ncbi:MAG: YbaK/EbsC family protein [Calditrichaeota bacterium]|nr:YbaK/EbsC family protein [Calditrichota bacterium]
MAVVPASYKINLDKFKEIAGAREVELASEEEFSNLFPNCELGAMPPFGMLYGLPTFVDRSLTEGEEIYFNAATHTEVIKMRFDDYQRLVEPVIASFAEHV